MLPLNQVLLRLAVAAALGAAIGVERDLRKKPAGVRTSLFVALGAALFTLLSGEIARRLGDTGSTRIASNIVQGIGFLGAGAIVRGSGSIVGMTTAATIWLEAAIGMATGAGLYSVAGFTTGLALFALVILGWCERAFGLRTRVMNFRITTNQSEALAGEVQRLLAELKISPQHFRVSMSGALSIVEFEADVSDSRQAHILTRLHREGLISEVTPQHE
ncbi:MAG: MgtC/SapB family protein [Terriglobales bacterium]|jgi:putative Mg2+ transporter-C (MgtC) family protein|nr:MgtC/SapB family protein [Terriglobales bacterium]